MAKQMQKFAMRWDKNENTIDYIDCEWIGEDADGVFICIHPEIALAEREYLWGPVVMYQTGTVRLRETHARNLSAFEFDALSTMASAYSRETKRRIAVEHERRMKQNDNAA